jgi:chromosomal replication initiator protein
MDQDRWRRVKERLGVELGDDVFTSWFGRMELDAVEKGVVRLSVPCAIGSNRITASAY